MKNKIENGFQIIHDLIKLKWVPEILESLNLGNFRYNQLLKSIQYISHTELNRKLTMLVERNVISKVTNGHQITYTLTPFGEDLVHIFGHLEKLEDRYFTEQAL